MLENIAGEICMELSSISGRRALVTGGALRIGRAICLALARAGADVVVHYRSSRKDAELLAREVRDLGVEASLISADFARDGACERCIAEAGELAGTIDVLVNSASVFHKDSLRSLSSEKLRSEMQVNLEAPLLLTKAFAEQTVAGDVVNLLDTRVAGDDNTCVPYLLSKKALESATRLAAIEYAPGIKVNAIAPGDVLPPNRHTSDYVTEYALPSPLATKPTPENIADALVFLVAMETVTGQTLYIDSGAHLLA